MGRYLLLGALPLVQSLCGPRRHLLLSLAGHGKPRVKGKCLNVIFLAMAIVLKPVRIMRSMGPVKSSKDQAVSLVCRINIGLDKGDFFISRNPLEHEALRVPSAALGGCI